MDGKTKHPGVRKRGSSIQIDFRFKNVRCRETLKIKPTPTNLKIASNKLGQIHMEITLNTLNYADHFPNSNMIKIFGGSSKSNMTISEALDWWWIDNKPEHHRSAKNAERIIKNHIKPGIGNVFLSDLKAKQVKNWIKDIPLSASSKNSILTPLRKMYEEACSDDLIDKNIMKKVSCFTREKKIKNPLNTCEVDLVLNHISISEAKYYYQFAIWSGLSTGEQLGLKWSDINFKKYQLTVSRMLVDNAETTTKNSYRERTIDLLSPAYHALQNLLPDDYLNNPKKYKSEYIFINPITKNAWRLEAISNHWKKAFKELNINYRRPYETRHTFASIMLTACLKDNWIRQQMGHANMEMLSRVYAKWMNDADKVIEWVLKHTKDGKNGAQFNKFFLEKYQNKSS